MLPSCVLCSSNVLPRQFRPTNLACKPCNSPSGGKEEIQFEARFSHIKFGNLPRWNVGRVPSRSKKRVRNRPVLNGRWRSLLISVANRWCTVQISCNIRVLSSRIGQCGNCCIALSIFQLSSNISFTFTVKGLHVCIFIVWYVKKNILWKYLWKHGQPLTNLQSCFATNYPNVLRILGHNSLACSPIFHITLL